MTPAPAPRIDPEQVMTWSGEGMSLGEIGHRLGVSADRLRELLTAAGVDTAQLDDPRYDDDCPNKRDSL